MGEISQIGKFKVVGKLGQGSFGVVYKGYDPDIRRDVAIKVCSVDDAGLRKRFAREAQISGNLQHKNIVTVFAADSDEQGIPYLVQELLDGEDLRELIRRREAMPSYRKIECLLQVARGLAHAHAHGVIHRDIKPANIRILAAGTAKIMDFGIAKLASAETQLTQKGVTMGTASYLPPEQVRGGELDHRADVFSFGVLAYEFLTYERPFRGNTLSALVYQILYKVPAPMNAVWPECPEVLSDLVAKCLEKKPEGRYASMEELIPRLEHIAEEIEAGKWPALRGVSTVQALVPEVPDDTGVMSQSDIARTARAVEPGDAEPGEDVRDELPPSPEATRPAAPEPAGGEASDLPSEMVPTEILPMPPVPPAPPPPAAAGQEAAAEAATVALPQDELAARAQQISTLIAQGNLEEARAHLEDTMSRRLEATGELSNIESALSSQALEPPAPSRSRVSPTAVTRRLAPEAEPPSFPGASAAAELELERPRSPGSGSTAERQPAPARPGMPDAAPPTDSETYRTAIFARPPWQLWAALAALVVVLAGAGWWWMGSGEPSGAAAPVTEEPSAPPLAAGTAPTPVGSIVCLAVPWAEITEITDADGFLKTLPSEPYTPLVWETAAGRYVIQLKYDPGDGESQLATCEVDVREGETARCEATFELPEVTDYFKESDWWS